MHGPAQNINSCKVIQTQNKSVKLTWLTTCGGGAGFVRFQGTNKSPAEGEDLNSLVVNAVEEILKSNKLLKAKDKHDSISEEEQENFNFEYLKIGEE